MQIKTSQLTGPALDWAVATCEGYYAHFKPAEVVYTHSNGDWHHNGNWRPSSNPVQGNPIVKRNWAAIQMIGLRWIGQNVWSAEKPSPIDSMRAFVASKLDETGGLELPPGGGELLAHFMRCYVASKLGDEVDVPDALLAIEPAAAAPQARRPRM